RRALCGNDTSAISRYFPQLLRSVMRNYHRSHRNIHEITRVFLINYNRGKALAMPTDNQLRTQLRETNAYSLMCIRSVLERIEHYGATAEVDTSQLNIEHIMPQRPNTYWKKITGIKDEEEYSSYVNLIGNLTLCAQYDNTRMGNQDFQFKKSVLSETKHIRMNTEILEKEKWTIEDIIERCDSLTKILIKIFPYQTAHPTIEEKPDDDIIVLTAPTVNAKAIYHNEQSIEILAGSTMKAYGPQEMKAMQSLYRRMVSLGVLVEEETGQVQFEKNYRFHDLNTAAQFLLHRGGDNTGAWTTENGTTFSGAKEQKEKPKKVNKSKKQTTKKVSKSIEKKIIEEKKPRKIETRKITKQTVRKKKEGKKETSLLQSIMKGFKD
ncbi:MAG: HNH endonuclease, partial [Solobacterium sp.]|nr:HNH endonuclease [Solobacterium sp.]